MNQAVLAVVAEILAERARALALAANRCGNFDEARRVVRAMIEHLRGHAPGNPRIEGIVDELQRVESEVRQQWNHWRSKRRTSFPMRGHVRAILAAAHAAAATDRRRGAAPVTLHGRAARVATARLSAHSSLAAMYQTVHRSARRDCRLGNCKLRP